MSHENLKIKKSEIPQSCKKILQEGQLLESFLWSFCNLSQLRKLIFAWSGVAGKCRAGLGQLVKLVELKLRRGCWTERENSVDW